MDIPDITEPMTALPSHPPTRLRVHHLGLDARDALLVESALRMSEDFAQRCTFGPSVPGEPVQVLFINGDSGYALARWQALQETQPRLQGVIVSREDPKRDDLAWLPSPITVRDCAAIIRILAVIQLQGLAGTSVVSTAR